MTRMCHSSSRCTSILCEACSWRYSLRIARRIQAHDPRQLHALQAASSIPGPSAFRSLRRSLHNSICYRRRHSRWWRRVGIWGWWDGTGLHGLVELGSITAIEFVSALQRQGDIHLRPLGTANVRTEVYRAARSASTVAGLDATGRYQPLKVAIEPVTTTRKHPVPIIDDVMVEAMPVLV